MIRLEQVSKMYRTERIETMALDNINLTVATGGVRLDHGPLGLRQEHAAQPDGPARRAQRRARSRSTARRSTRYGDRDLARAAQREDRLHLPEFHLIPDLSVVDNVEIPLLYRQMSGQASGGSARSRRSTAWGSPRASHHFPSQLSGGQQQRVAIARAIVGRPRILLADEPTGNLDSQMGDEIMGILQDLNENEGTTVVMVTHDPRLAERDAPRRRLFDGRQVK